MKKLLGFLILSFVSTFLCWAEMPKTASVMGGVHAINSEIGYAAGVFSPYSDHLSLFVQFSQLMPPQTDSYLMLTAGGIRRIVQNTNWDAYFKTASFAILDRQVLNFGLNFAMGAEYLTEDSQHLALFSELGYSFPFVTRTYAQGVAMQLGLKYYI